MTCDRCESQRLEEGTTTFTIERGDLVLVVRHVPALVCSQCGEEYVDATTHERLAALAEQGERERAQVVVREYGEVVSA